MLKLQIDACAMFVFPVFSPYFELEIPSLQQPFSSHFDDRLQILKIFCMLGGFCISVPLVCCICETQLFILLLPPVPDVALLFGS